MLQRTEEPPSYLAHQLTDTELREPRHKQQVHIDLQGGTAWTHDCCDGATGNALLRSVLTSNRVASDKGFEAGFTAQLLRLEAAEILKRVNDTRVTIEVPALLSYAIPVGRVEHIRASSIPTIATTAEKEITTLTGPHSVVIVKTALAVHGTLFHVNPRSDDELRLDQGHLLHVDLEGDRWLNNVVANPTVKKKMLGALLTSDHTEELEGYSHAFAATWRRAIHEDLIAVTMVSTTRITVKIPSLMEYKLPKGGKETISIGKVVGEAVSGESEIASVDLDGSNHRHKITYVDRRATVTGSFFGRRVTQDEIRTASGPLEVIITLSGAEWIGDIVPHMDRRHLLAEALFTPAANAHPGGAPMTAWTNQFRWENITEHDVKLMDKNTLSIKLPPIPKYAAPGGAPEYFQVKRIPALLLARAHSDILEEKIEGKTKAEVVNSLKASQSREL